ncbi:acyl-CoA dehydrogenase family protein [Coraliomargarita parva]|uniref:acyl-CoA dehydrogenase family protein n=1 Tax=Coraliomargarita parva TaxID=3014050 RepID=UPI0022B2E6B3|nr:acyl-CoA dehydrogenase family protein [Coraliomargarita parva]
MKTSEDTRDLIDTSGMSEGQRLALEAAESSRDSRMLSGLAASLFDGCPRFDGITPFPLQSREDAAEGDRFLSKLKHFLAERTDPDAIDREGEIPTEVIEGLAQLGAFGIKIPRQYGGLGLSQSNYSRAAMELGRNCGNLTALLSAHQSIGVPQPLLIFGTEAQKQRYLPLFAKGQISAFALTEKDVGSDPARMKTEATPDQDGKGFRLNGEKLWCTNGLKASHIIVMARTPSVSHQLRTTAFIVDMSWPGVEIVTRCHFMGLRALYNGVLRFRDVYVPRENIVLEEGKGLKVALTTLNTGRLTLPAACTGLMQRCLDIVLRWSRQREQWGKPIGQHAAIAEKIAEIAADAFVTEAMVRYTSSLVDRDKHADIRLEAAMSKLWGSEAAWRTIDATMQIKGGRGYETADSLRNRGESPDPVERMMRDCRINTIFEGSSEIMHLFIAREALDPHLRFGGPVLDRRKPGIVRLRAGLRAMSHYARWYPAKYLPGNTRLPPETEPELYVEFLRIERLSRKLACALFHRMLRYGPALESRQLVLARLVKIGTELFAMTCACAYAQARHDLPETAVPTAKYVCRRGQHRIQTWFKELDLPLDSMAYNLAQTHLKTREVH